MNSILEVCLVARDAVDFFDRHVELAHALERAGAATTVVAGEALGPVDEPGDVDVRPVPPRVMAGNAASNAALASILVARWSDSRPDLVHCLDVELMPAVAFAARTVGVAFRVVTLNRSFEHACGGGRGVRRRVARRAAAMTMAPAVRSAQRAVALHASARRSWQALGVAESRIRLLDSGMGINLGPVFDGLDAAERRRRGRKRMGIDESAQAVGVIDGPVDGGAALELEGVDLIRGAALRRVGERRAAPTSVDERLDVLAACDLVVSLETRVEQALIVQSAAALGVPCVALRVAGHEEIVRNNHTGLLVSGGSAELTSAARELLADAERLEALGGRARSFAARLFDRDLAVRKVLSAYDELLSGDVGHAAHVTSGGELIGRGR